MTPTTLADIAAAAGCSRITASYVLRGIGRFTPATRTRILEAAKRLGYRPRGAAKGLGDGTFGTIAFVTAGGFGLRAPFLISAAAQALATRNRHLLYAEMPWDLDPQQAVPRVIKEWCVDGIIYYCNADVPQALAAEIAARDIAVVWANSDGRQDCIIFDEVGAARAATTELLRLGHRRIAFCDDLHLEHDTHHCHVDRRRGYRDAMEAAGLPPRFDQVLRTEVHQVLRGAQYTAMAGRLLAGVDRPTAVVTVAPRVAQALIVAALSRGLEIPRDLSLTTIDPAPQHLGGIAISTWIQPLREAGLEGVDMLMAKLLKHGQQRRSRLIPFGEPLGATMAPPPRSGRRREQ